MDFYKVYLEIGKFQAFLVDYHFPLFRVILNTPTKEWKLEDNWEKICLVVDNG